MVVSEFCQWINHELLPSSNLPPAPSQSGLIPDGFSDWVFVPPVTKKHKAVMRQQQTAKVYIIIVLYSMHDNYNNMCSMSSHRI